VTDTFNEPLSPTQLVLAVAVADAANPVHPGPMFRLKPELVAPAPQLFTGITLQ